MAKILDGKALSQKIASELAEKILLSRVAKTAPIKLVIIQIGDLPASTKFIEMKKAFAKKIRIEVEHRKYPAIKNTERNNDNNDTREDEIRQIIDDIQTYNSDPKVHGIMVQLPIPTQSSGDTITKADPITTGAILNTIDPSKDVDGLTATSMKRLVDGKQSEGFIPATTRGIITLLEHHDIDLVSKKVVMVGQSALVGRPTALALLNRRATVTICNSATIDLDKITCQADILIIATGHPGLITANHVSPGQVVIDVGINIVPNPITGTETSVGASVNKVVGDVDFPAVSQIVSAISPVPGGVGPMTIVSLFQNLVDAVQ